MTKTSKIIIGIIIAIIVIGGIWYGVSRKPREAEVINVGVVVPLSGKFGYAGESVRQGLELAKDSLGGVIKPQIELIYQDSICDNKEAANAARALIDIQGVKIIIGDWCSGGVLTMAPITEANGVILFAQGASPEITEAGEYVFRNVPDVKLQLPALLSLLKSGESIYALYPNNDFGVTYKKQMEEIAPSKGIKIVGSEAYSLTDFKDIRTTLSKIKKAGPDFILFPGIGPVDYVSILRQMKELDVQSKILAHSTFQNSEVISNQDIKDYIEKRVFYSYYFEVDSNEPKIKEFREKFVERYNKIPDVYAATAFDAFHILYNQIKKCGDDPKCIRNELYTEKYTGVLGETSFDRNGDVMIPIIIKTIKNGKFVPYEE